jgi:hypothetical protein
LKQIVSKVFTLAAILSNVLIGSETNDLCSHLSDYAILSNVLIGSETNDLCSHLSDYYRDNQLYVGMMLAKLRQYQRKGGVPDFREFCTEVVEACVSAGQSGP